VREREEDSAIVVGNVREHGVLIGDRQDARSSSRTKFGESEPADISRRRSSIQR
jgi:hypothetical protein